MSKAPNGLTLTCVHVGVDSVWEQGKLEATLREMLAAGAARPTGSPTRQVHALLGNLKSVQDQQEFRSVVCNMHGIFGLAE